LKPDPDLRYLDVTRIALKARWAPPEHAGPVTIGEGSDVFYQAVRVYATACHVATHINVYGVGWTEDEAIASLNTYAREQPEISSWRHFSSAGRELFHVEGGEKLEQLEQHQFEFTQGEGEHVA
jgi:hypothetical protein